MKRKALGGAYLRGSGDSAGRRRWMRYGRSPDEQGTDEQGSDGQDWKVYRAPTTGERSDEPAAGPPGTSAPKESARKESAPKESAPNAPTGGSRSRRGVVIAAGCGAGVVAAGGIAFAVHAERHQLPEIAYDHVIDPATYEQVLAALERTTGSTDVLEFEAKVYDHGPTIQVVVPPNDAQPLSVTYQWEAGALEHYYADPADPDDVAFDLADFSAATLNALDRETRTAVDDGIAIAGVTIAHDEWDGAVVIESELVDRDLDHFSTFADQDGDVTGTDEWENG